MNLIELINLSAKYADTDATNVQTKEILKDGINAAYLKIAREKLAFEYTETITPINQEIDFKSLANTFLKLKSINVNGAPLLCDIEMDKIKVFADGEVKITYYYLPKELENDLDISGLPPNIEHRSLCYYAAFHYLNIDGDETASKWLSLWEDLFKNMNTIKFEQTQVVNVYGGLV